MAHPLPGDRREVVRGVGGGGGGGGYVITTSNHNSK